MTVLIITLLLHVFRMQMSRYEAEIFKEVSIKAAVRHTMDLQYGMIS